MWLELEGAAPALRPEAVCVAGDLRFRPGSEWQLAGEVATVTARSWQSHAQDALTHDQRTDNLAELEARAQALHVAR